MIEVPGEQAAARVGDAKRAMNEHLEFGVGAFLTDFRDLFERQLTRQNDPADAGTGPEPHSGRVDGIGLHRRWTFTSGQVSRTIMIRPGSDMISASGPNAMAGAMSRR